MFQEQNNNHNSGYTFKMEIFSILWVEALWQVANTSTIPETNDHSGQEWEAQYIFAALFYRERETNILYTFLFCTFMREQLHFSMIRNIWPLLGKLKDTTKGGVLKLHNQDISAQKGAMLKSFSLPQKWKKTFLQVESTRNC